MGTFNKLAPFNSPPFVYLILILALALSGACKNDEKKTQQEADGEDNVIEIISVGMDFQMPDTINSGWKTFRYRNQSPYTHFFLIDKYPEGMTSEDAEKYVAPVFDRGMELIMEGKSEEGFAEFSNLPEWFSDVVFLGGSGLVSPKNTSETFINMQPGNYILECYVKMSNGIFHTSMGMTKDLVVTNNDSGNKPPQADIEIELSSTEGIVFDDNISSGEKIFSVNFKDQIVHENFVGHDINLAKLDESANLEELEEWMNWAIPKGLMDPAPDGVTFMGGVNDMPEGHTAYFRVTLNPGTYVLISEVPNASGKNMLKTFLVSDD